MCCDISAQGVPSHPTVCPTETQVGGEATVAELTREVEMLLG